MKTEFTEKRKHKRFNMSPHLVAPVSFRDRETEKIFSGIIVDLSAGGMCLISYQPLSIGTEIHIDFDLGQIRVKDVAGKIVRLRENYKTYMAGIQFLKINRTIQEEINMIAEDYENCEEKSMTDPAFECFVKCCYYFFCSKPIKKE